jgi:integrase
MIYTHVQCVAHFKGDAKGKERRDGRPMAILAECPFCHKKQAVKNRQCDCGADLVKLKKAQKVRYWIQYRLPGGKQRKEYVGLSIEEARDAAGKRRSQKREKRIFDIKPEAKMTFNELADWYLGLEKLKTLSYYDTLKGYLKKFNSEYGDMIVGDIKAVHLENLQAKRKSQGYADSTIDQEIGAARSMINKAFDNDQVGGETLRAFKRAGKLLKRNSNSRDKILSREQFDRLMGCSPRHTKEILLAGFYTGMRLGEILSLTWDKVNMEKRVIHLEAADTKDKEPRLIPISDELHEILKAIPKPIHDNHVFLFKGKPIKDIRTGLKKACGDAEISYGRFVQDGYVFHDLRHTFNTYMRKAGVPESVIMEITGHSTREMFDRYNTIDHEDRRLAINRLQSYLKSANDVTQNVTQVDD